MSETKPQHERLRIILNKRKANLLEIEMQKAEFIDPDSVPLDLKRAERSTRNEIARIEAWLEKLETDQSQTETISSLKIDEQTCMPLSPMKTRTPITILIPAGNFWMGSPSDDPEAHLNEIPCRKLDLPEYSIGRYPVTNAEYARFLAENPSHPAPHSDKEMAQPYNWDSHKRIYPEGKADHPVVLVSWEDANAYCHWLSQITGKHYRLPTEEEWGKAARGGFPETRRYPWGDEWKPNACNTLELKRGGTTPIHEFEKANQSPFGIVDMAGNVWEWTSSSYESRYHGQCYLVRGGSWQNSSEKACISYQGRYPPDTRRPYLGFRVVLESKNKSEEPDDPNATS